jgi:2,3,4,5-tetrahydropyridine-2-carboxylate N-succinyltransferase
MEVASLQTIIENGWEERDSVTPATQGQLRDAVTETLNRLGSGKLRVAEKIDGQWIVRQWAKEAVLLSFRLNSNTLMTGSSTHVTPGLGPWWDKVPSKFQHWNNQQFQNAGFRAVPGSIVRHGAHIGKDVILMPSFVNIGAYVDEDTMVDTWATVGSCAQIGKRVHLSGGVGIGGVLEPLQANPTIIEDDCFIGARSEVVEGVIVGQGSVLSMGVFLTSTTKIIDRNSGEVHQGYVPPYSVVVPGSLADLHYPGLSTSCAVIMKTVDAQTRSKTSINDLLRD